MISVIVPFVREWPQIAFTIRSIHESLATIEHEVIAIDNLMPKMKEDRATKNIQGMANNWENYSYPWLKYYRYTDKLSHWNCKNFGMEKASGDFFWFIDGHCIVPRTAVDAARYYKANYMELCGSLHMPLTYHILEPRQLMYKAVIESGAGDYHYTFHTFSKKKYEQFTTVEVPAMSTCGMLIHRTFMEQVGFWPSEMGIYGGGENFMNYTMAVLGLKKHVWVGDSLCHHGDKRGYNWNHYDYQRNKSIAVYMFGGRRVLDLWLDKRAKLNGDESRRVKQEILNLCHEQRQWIEDNQLMEIEEWVSTWKNHELMNGG